MEVSTLTPGRDSLQTMLDPERLFETALALVSIPSPTGDSRRVAQRARSHPGRRGSRGCRWRRVMGGGGASIARARRCRRPRSPRRRLVAGRPHRRLLQAAAVVLLAAGGFLAGRFGGAPRSETASPSPQKVQTLRPSVWAIPRSWRYFMNRAW